MKSSRKKVPSYLVPADEFERIRSGESHLFTMPLTEKNLSVLPKAYADSTGTVLIFPTKECPSEFSFRTAGVKDTCRRAVVNIMAYKQEDGSEIIKVRLK